MTISSLPLTSMVVTVRFGFHIEFTVFVVFLLVGLGMNHIVFLPVVKVFVVANT